MKANAGALRPLFLWIAEWRGLWVGLLAAVWRWAQANQAEPGD